ncbi:acetyltransferase [Limnochorda pilosa]|uniref:Acetyltransferase n=1 Tax=Limnochorda pilosa TaxID=1555112 RepID=A0A0K2SKZ8_LIMPI|nr:acetyltransferase [Limnochorda pilosa]
MQRADLPVYARWFSDPGLQALVNPGVVFPYTEEDEEKWYEEAVRRPRAEGRGYTFAIRLREGDRLIGNVSLANVDAKNRSATYGIAIADPAARGQGYGREATELILRFGFRELNLHRIQLWVFAYNERAIRMYREIGFQEEGRRRESIFRDGRYHDDLLMAILDRDFHERHGDGESSIPAEASRVPSPDPAGPGR